MTEPTTCNGRLVYRSAHAEADRWWVTYTPDGRRLTCCSVECLLEALCEPGESPPSNVLAFGRRSSAVGVR